MSLKVGERVGSDEARLHALLSSLDDLVFECDRDGTYLSVWSTREEVLVAPPEQLRGRNVREALGDDVGGLLLGAIHQTLDSGRPQVCEYGLEVPAGQRWFQARLAPIQDAPKADRVCALVRDITDHRLAEDERHRAEQWFERLVQNSSDLIIVLDEKARLQYANPITEKVFGASFRRNLGRTLFEKIHPEDRERARAAFAMDLAAPGAHRKSVYRVRTASGEWRFLELAVTNCLEDPAVRGLVVNAHDITDSTNLTRALRTLGESNQVLVQSQDEKTLLEEMCRVIVDLGGYLLAWIGYAGEEESQPIRAVAAYGRTGYLNGLRVVSGDEVYGSGPTGTAIRMGQIRVVRDTHRSRSFRPWREQADRFGLRTTCALPLILGGVTIGALSIYAGEPGAFDEQTMSVLRDLADDVSYGIGRIRDRAALESSEERFRTLAAAAPIGILEIAPNGLITYANATAGAIGGRDPSLLMGHNWAEGIHPDDKAALTKLAEQIPETDGIPEYRFRIARPDGQVRQVQMCVAPRSDSRSSTRVVTIDDITEEVAAREALAHQAFYDELTGLPNRALCLDRLGQELANRRRRRDPLAVLFMDLDRLKIVNDSLGHDVGDAVLREIGQRFHRATRAGESVARFSGDEFVFILRCIKDVDDAVAVAKRLLHLLQQPIVYEGHEIIVSGSVGIVLVDGHTDAMSVIRDADTAMYQAKAAGRNRYAIFTESLHHSAMARFALEGELREALARLDFMLLYQPLVEPATGHPVSAEALVRWKHPLRGIVSPQEFIPVAEDTGMIKPLGNWVISEAISQLAEWDAQNFSPCLDTMAINLSACQLDDPGTTEVLGQALGRFRISPERVSLELTESAVMAEGASESLEIFSQLGVKVAIDDFGTGYSSLSYLHNLPVSTVKVDRSFIERLGRSDDSTPIVKAIVEMGHALGLTVVAEGVEDERCARTVASLGCDLAQGYHWARPLPGEELPSWWSGRARKRP